MAKATASVFNNSINVPAVKHDDLMGFFDKAYKSHIALMMHGTFGIGKSAVMKQFAKKKAKELKLEYSENPNDVNDPKKFLCIVINLHQFDVSGFWLPVFMNGKYTQQINDMFPISGQGLIFFDEINLAPNMVQANAYQFILDRRLGNYVVPEGYAVYAAGNTVTDNAHIHEMATPLKNRMSHFLLNPPTSAEWVENYALGAGIDHRVINFLLFADQYMHKYNPDISENVFGIPTPRSWEFVSRLIEDVKADGDKGTLYNIAASNIGTECAREFVAFATLSQNINVAKIFKDGKCEVPTEIDQIFALMSSMISYYSKTPKTAATLCKLAMQFKDEHTIMILKQAKGINPTFLKDVAAMDQALFDTMAKKYVKLII